MIKMSLYDEIEKRLFEGSSNFKNETIRVLCKILDELSVITQLLINKHNIDEISERDKPVKKKRGRPKKIS